MSRHIRQDNVQDRNGNVLSGATVTVYLANSTTLASIYSAISGGTAITGSAVTSDSAGKYTFYIDDSEYPPNQRFKIIASMTGYASQTDDYIKIIPDETYKYFVDAKATDQGAATTRGDRSIKDLVDAIGTSRSATLILAHSGTGNTTTYTLTTSETVPSNIKIEIENGAILGGAGTLTVYSPGHIFTSPYQQIYGGSGSLAFTVGGTVYVEWFGPDGTSDEVEINAAITSLPAAGGKIELAAKTYSIGSQITITKSNIHFYGQGKDNTTIQTVSSSSDLGSGNINLQSGINYITISDLTIDGNSDNNSSNNDAGIYAVAVDHLTIRYCLIKNTPKNGITLKATTTPNTNFNIHDNNLQNIGWRGIIVNFGRMGHISRNTIYSSGSHGIMVEKGTAAANLTRHVTINDNVVNRQVSPSTILTGQSEEGFLIGIGEASQEITVDGNICYDNRNATDDGIGWAQSTPGAVHRRIIISNNVVIYAGAYGIDAVNQSIVTGNIIHNSGTMGISVANDLGETWNRIIISNNIVMDSNERAQGDSAGIMLLSGVGGGSLTDVKISDNVIVEGGNTVEYAIWLDATNASYERIEIKDNNLRDCNTQSIKFTSTGFTDMFIEGNIIKGGDIGTLVDNATPSVLGYSKWLTGGTTTITDFDDGVTGQIIHIIAEHSIKITEGTHIFLNGSADFDMVATDALTLICKADNKWYELARSDNT